MPRLEPERPDRPLEVDYMVAADLLGVSPGVLLRWLREGEFPGERRRTRWCLSLGDIAHELRTTPERLQEELLKVTSNPDF